MIKYFLTTCLFIVSHLQLCASDVTLFNSPEVQNIPSAFQGRFRPLSSTAEQWYYQYSKLHAIPKDLKSQYFISTRSPLELFWMIHFLGIKPWEDTPFFSINSSPMLQSYNTLLKNKDLIDDPQLYHLLNEFDVISSSQPRVLPLKSPAGLWVSLKRLKNSTKNFTSYDDATFIKIRENYLALDNDVQELFYVNGNLDLNNHNPILENQIQLKSIALATSLTEAYSHIAGKPIDLTLPIDLSYPSLNQIRIEWFYTHYPLIEILLCFYGLALMCYLFSLIMKSTALEKSAVVFSLIGFVLHTTILAVRCYILGRPPVSNMYETIIYVPWIAVLLSIGIWLYSKQKVILFSGTTIAFVLLLILRLTKMEANLENLQAVLNSQYWLVIHVLMIVASYGAFLLCGTLAHIYLYRMYFAHVPKIKLEKIGALILQTMYIGTLLIIPGTILGGVWAAESWGRFWDWDPKESWAFISSCLYLIFIHSYRFNRIHYAGLAVGAILGLLSISFTWYGVNYILGTGMHSYGFGSGGAFFYYLFIIAELMFLGIIGIRQRQTLSCQ